MIRPDRLAINHTVEHFEVAHRKNEAKLTKFLSERKEIVL